MRQCDRLYWASGIPDPPDPTPFSRTQPPQPLESLPQPHPDASARTSSVTRQGDSHSAGQQAPRCLTATEFLLGKEWPDWNIQNEDRAPKWRHMLGARFQKPNDAAAAKC